MGGSRFPVELGKVSVSCLDTMVIKKINWTYQIKERKTVFGTQTGLV